MAILRKRSITAIDMTSGNIAVCILKFSLPLLVGNVLQQLYNTVDTWVVGNYVSNEAFSAVGSVAPAINALISLFLGFSTGSGVVISQFFGAGENDDLSDSITTSLISSVFIGLFLTVVGILCIPWMLAWMKTPDSVKPFASSYLRVYFYGLIGLCIYNMGSGILRALGDSVRTFYYLAICTVLNIVLDLVFVLVLKWGVTGVALATVIAELVSAILILISIMRSPYYKKKSITVSLRVLGKMLRIGLPTAVEMMIMSLSNMFAFSYINNFGADCMSGWTAYDKIDQLVQLPLQSLSIAIVTFVGQNIGNKDVERAHRGIRITSLISLFSVILTAVPILIFARYLVSFFNSKPEVVEYGTKMLYWITPCYLLNCVNRIVSGALRGAGKTYQPTLICIASVVVFRQLYLLAVSKLFPGSFIPVVMAFPAGWLVFAVSTYIYYKRTDLDNSWIVENEIATGGAL